jgi:hypothetical protein
LVKRKDGDGAGPPPPFPPSSTLDLTGGPGPECRKNLPSCHIFPDLMTLMFNNRVNGPATMAGAPGMIQRKTGEEPWFG